MSLVETLIYGGMIAFVVVSCAFSTARAGWPIAACLAFSATCGGVVALMVAGV